MKLGIICTMINGFGRRGFYNTQEIGLGRELVRQGHAVTIYKCVKKEGAGEAERVELGDRLIVESETCQPSGLEEARICMDFLKAQE